MKRVIFFVLTLFISFTFVSCSDQGILKSVQEAKKTSSVKVIDWIDDTHFLGTSGVCSYKERNKIILGNNGISKVSLCNSEWYVLYTLGGKLYKGVLENGLVKLDENPVQMNVSCLTNSGFWIKNKTVGFGNKKTELSSKIINAIEYDGELLVQTTEGIAVYDKALTCTKENIDFSGSVYGFVKFNSKYYVLTSTNLFCLDDINTKLLSNDLTSVENNSPVFAFSDTLVIRDDNAYKCTSDLKEFRSCLELLNDTDIVDVVKYNEETFIVATSDNGVYEVKCNSGMPEINSQFF